VGYRGTKKITKWKTKRKKTQKKAVQVQKVVYAVVYVKTEKHIIKSVATAH